MAWQGHGYASEHFVNPLIPVYTGRGPVRGLLSQTRPVCPEGLVLHTIWVRPALKEY